MRIVEAYREGWLGVWDALVAAVLRRPRITVPTPLTLSAWVKIKENSTHIADAQLSIAAHR